ncbi:LytR C-terminal domain-containing protein [Brachybacterium halotolerans subsp. kimchii]|uniref:LytR C-terminal domain-containing protein n=1 Tax=Brachybacterium halotolerans TaxID=2795215 RepID=UPI001E409E9C|nr:LytR C-terminal domain-containing protein [Brachybacterium halotolerans]UEJ84138.1 LytR C-terminal domain-containing protein [Brachybacterium halotolerans subsp. kimchii]
MSSSHRDAHPYGRSNDDVRRRDQRRRRQRRVRITQLVVFSLAMIGMICALTFAFTQLTADDDVVAAGPSDAGADVATGKDGVHCPDPGAKPAKPKKVEVSVLNGTSRSGLAASVSETLADRGFSTGKAGNTKAASGSVTIVYGPAGYLQASAVAAEFSKPALKLDDREDTTVDVLVGDGFKDVVDEDVAAKTLKKAVKMPAGCSGAEDSQDSSTQDTKG